MKCMVEKEEWDDDVAITQWSGMTNKDNIRN